MSKHVKLQMTIFSLISLSAHHLLIFTFPHYSLYCYSFSSSSNFALTSLLSIFLSFFFSSHHLCKVSHHPPFLNSTNSYPTSQCSFATKATDFCVVLYTYIFTPITIKFNSGADILYLKLWLFICICGGICRVHLQQKGQITSAVKIGPWV